MIVTRTSQVIAGVMALWLSTLPVRAADEVKLEAKFPEGQTLRYRVRTSKNQQTKGLGMEMPSNQDRTEVWTDAIGKRRKDGGVPVAVQVELSRDRRRLPGGRNVLYEGKGSKARIDYPEYEFFQDLYQVEGQYAYTAVLDGTSGGKVKAIEGADALRDRVAKIDPRAGDLLRSTLAPDALEQEFRRVHVLSALPDGPVKPGTSWERTEAIDQGAGLEMVYHRKYDYAGTEKRGGKTLHKINVKVLDVQFRQDSDSSSPLKPTKSEIKVGSSDGTILFDAAAGRVVDSRERMELTGSLTLSAQGQDQRTTFDLSIRTEIQLQ